jgi:serine/threonine-protein kinase
VEGRYAIEGELGHGGMATVFLARDQHLPRNVAIKILDPSLTSSLGVERFLREIEITARLQHPHILPLLESGMQGGLVYYVMPHVTGESLRDRLSRDGQLPVRDAVGIAREVADALAYAHAQGVVHRDVKPENILLSGGHAVVADFGIARAIETCATCNADGLTVAGAPIGTPTYMSPEQAEGNAVDGRSDVYALGCVLYEMLAGRPPFVARSARALMTQHVTTPPPTLAEFRPGLPPELLGAVERALAKPPDERFQTAAAFAEELQLLVAAEVVSHSTPDPGRRSAAQVTPVPAPESPASRSGRVLVLSALAAAAALGATTLAPKRPKPRAAAVPPAAAAVDPATGGAYAASIAVMPLANYSGDERAAFLSEGLTEEIIAQLARIRGLKVISRTSVVALADKGLTVPQIAETLGVRNVLEGSVQRAGERIRVTLQLIDARADAHLWAESYDRELKDAIALRQEIGRKVGAALAMTVPGVEAPPEAERTSHGAAYDAYLKGNYWLTRTSPDGLDQAIGAFEEAIRIDSTYAPAYAGLSTALRQWVNLGYAGEREPYATFERAAQAADRALALDPELPMGFLARGLMRIYAFAPPDSALADLERALALMPNAGVAHAGLSVGFARLGRWNDALAQVQAAVQLDPLSAGMHGAAAVTALGAKRYDLAIEENRRALSLEPNFVGGRAIEAVAEMLLGRPERCLALDLGGFPEMRAICLHAIGRAAEAAAVIDSLEPIYAAGGSERIFQLGVISAYYARRGDGARAGEWMRRAFDRSPSGLEFRVISSGLFDPVRDDPHWLAALDTIRRTVSQRVFR